VLTDQLLENIGAPDVKFSTAEWKEFNKQLDAIQFQGERLPAFVQAFSDVEAPLKKK
jgi:hypothetical protein